MDGEKPSSSQGSTLEKDPAFEPGLFFAQIPLPNWIQYPRFDWLWRGIPLKCHLVMIFPDRYFDITLY